ncbi:MAG: 5'/3'-nucleotidase SurE [Chloroflexota bacterium]|nr:5'/3'-nucleotidase SurE [Chloroflexota bacterium]
MHSPRTTIPEATGTVRILLTNDDGITSEGLWAAARGLARVGHLTVIGTTEDWSGCGAAVRMPLGTRLLPYADIPDDVGGEVEAYAVDAAPGAAILIGLMTELFAPFDLVASGANYGVNIGTDLVHSGTLGAAATGFQRGVNAFGISQDRGYPRGEPQAWDGVSDVAERLARWFGARTGPPILLNVNLPNRRFEEMAGVAIVRPVKWGNIGRVELTVEPEQAGGWMIGVAIDRLVPMPNEPGTDSGAVLAGEIAISPVVPTGADIPASPDELRDLSEALLARTYTGRLTS